MATVNFKCTCPCIYCRGNGPIIQWECPDCKTNKLLEDTGKTICPGCGKNSSYIWKQTFTCHNHDDNPHKISFQGLFVALSRMGNDANPSVGFAVKISQQVFEHKDEFPKE